MPRVVKPAQFGAPMGMYSYGVAAAGEIVVVAGMTGLIEGGHLAGPDVESQTKAALESVRGVVEAAGCSMRDVVRFQTFLTSADHIPGFMKARQEVFPRYFPGGSYPTNTLVIVSGLFKPELLVEIEAMAVKPTRAAAAARMAAPRKTSATKRSARRRARR